MPFKDILCVDVHRSLKHCLYVCAPPYPIKSMCVWIFLLLLLCLVGCRISSIVKNLQFLTNNAIGFCKTAFPRHYLGGELNQVLPFKREKVCNYSTATLKLGWFKCYWFTRTWSLVLKQQKESFIINFIINF